MVAGVAGAAFVFFRFDLLVRLIHSFSAMTESGPENITQKVSAVNIPPPLYTPGLLDEPIPDFSKRVTKKPFGIFVTPQNSPVENERFSGFHTGVDAEIFPDELNKNFFVKAVADGILLDVRESSGYGGLVVIEHTIAGKALTGIYGHLRLGSVLAKPHERIKRGEIIGVLGDDKSKETGGERKHLHFGLYRGKTPDIRGYVETKEELEQWVNPLQFF